MLTSLITRCTGIIFLQKFIGFIMCVRESVHIYICELYFIFLKQMVCENIYSLPNILAMDEFMKFKPIPLPIQSARSALASS